MRSFPDRPVVGVGAVIFDGSTVLLVKRGHAPLKGDWSLPGGAVELGETLEAAVVREIREETGLDVAVQSLVEAVDRIHHAADGRVEYHYVVVDFLCRPSNTSKTSNTAALPCAGSDADEVRWVPLEKLAAYHLSSAARAVIDKALELSVRKP